MEENLFSYPAVLNLNGKRCAVIGGGKVALRKVRTLLASGAQVTVTAPAADAALIKLAGEGRIALNLRGYQKGDADCFLAVAATDDAALNRIIAQDAPCLVNVITEPELGNFSVPAQRSSGRLTFTAFGGGLPAFSRLLAQDMAKTYGGNFAAFADFLAEARQKVQQLPLTPAQRTAFWREMLDEESIGLLHEGHLNILKERITNAINSLGLNHKTAPVEVREGFNFSADRIARILRRLRNYDNLDEAVLLSTCNRTEFYMVLEEPVSGMKFIQTLVKHLAGNGYKTEYFYNLSGVNCVRHLFKVASSLDSLVIGEGQILSQIKNAYQIARENSMTGTIFNTIFNRAIATGKRVRTETKIAYSSVSVSSAAVDLAMDVLGSIEDANILVLGAGRMSELTARHLIDKGAKTIFVSNRNFDHAKELADKFNGTAIAYNKYLEQAETSDIIITSTGAPHYVIREKDMREVTAKRGGRPLILIDIAVPRDVDPKVAQLPGITLYNIDDLEGVVDTNKHFRTHEAKMAEAIIEEEISELKERLRYLTMRPVMVQLHEKMNFLREKVLKRAFAKMPELTEHERRIIDIMTQRLEHKFLREPMTAMNAAAGTPDEERLRKVICELFLLNYKGEDYIGDENKFDYWD